MDENKQKIIAMAMQMCVETSSDSESNDDEVYRIAKRPKLKTFIGDVNEIPTDDLISIKKMCIEIMDDQRNFLRLDDSTFEKLISFVKPLMQKEEINGKQELSAKERLILTLSYLATGRSYNEMIFSSSRTIQTLFQIIYETCDIIFKCLRSDYLRVSKVFQFNYFHHRND